MEISDIKRRVVDTIERAKRHAGERRSRVDEATREYDRFLDQIAVPMFKQVSNVLRAENFLFTVFTPGGSVRLMSDRAAEDYVELILDASGDEPAVMGHASRARGRRVVESEEPLGAPATLTEQEVLTFLLKMIGPLVER